MIIWFVFTYTYFQFSGYKGDFLRDYYAWWWCKYTQYYFMYTICYRKKKDDKLGYGASTLSGFMLNLKR